MIINIDFNIDDIDTILQIFREFQSEAKNLRL